MLAARFFCAAFVMHFADLASADALPILGDVFAYVVAFGFCFPSCICGGRGGSFGRLFDFLVNCRRFVGRFRAPLLIVFMAYNVVALTSLGMIWVVVWGWGCHGLYSPCSVFVFLVSVERCCSCVVVISDG